MQRCSRHSGGRTASTAVYSHLCLYQCSTRSFFKAPWSKKGEGKSATGEGGFPSSPFNFDPSNVRLIQSMLQQQSPEKQKELMDQAMKLQKTFSRIPGFKKMAERQAAMMGNMMAGASPVQQQGTTSTAATATSSSSVSTKKSGSPSLDELRKMNLGDEIEALFTELRILREKKNEYRSQYYSCEAELQEVKGNAAASEQALRRRLQKAEQEVVLLNSEVLDVQGKVNELTKALKEGQSRGTSMADSDEYRRLQHTIQGKEEALQSSQRRMHRLRRQNPLLQFSVACSELQRLFSSSSSGGGPAENQWDQWMGGEQKKCFERLQSQYQGLQAEAWRTACQSDHAAAQTFLHAVHSLALSALPHANYDACVAIEHGHGEANAAVEVLTALFSPLDYTVTAAEPSEADVCEGVTRFIVKSPAGPLVRPGPYAYAAAALWASATPSGSSSVDWLKGVVINSVYPCISHTLLHNSERTTLSFDYARSSGPGGQAVNVAETQVHGKVVVDGAVAFSTSSQESRSTLQNRTIVTERMEAITDKRATDGLVLRSREAVQQAVLATPHSPVSESTRAIYKDMTALVEKGAEDGAVSVLDVKLLQAIEQSIISS